MLIFSEETVKAKSREFLVSEKFGEFVDGMFLEWKQLINYNGPFDDSVDVYKMIEECDDFKVCEGNTHTIHPTHGHTHIIHPPKKIYR